MISFTGKNSIKRLVQRIHDRYGNVENKSSATIRSEITKQNVTSALGYTPPQFCIGDHYMEVKNGHLYVVYDDNTTPPDYRIENGHLIRYFELNE